MARTTPRTAVLLLLAVWGTSVRPAVAEDPPGDPAAAAIVADPSGEATRTWSLARAAAASGDEAAAFAALAALFDDHADVPLAGADGQDAARFLPAREAVEAAFAWLSPDARR